MTSYLFRILGGVAFVVGLGWSVLVFLGGGAGAGPGATMILARLAVAAPGLALAFGGLVLLAVGEALWLLERIARSTARTMHNTADIAKALKPLSTRNAAPKSAPAVGDIHLATDEHR